MGRLRHIAVPMKHLLPALLLTLLVGSPASAQSSSEAAAAAKPEAFLLLPEPRTMGSSRSMKPRGASATVLTPAREIPDSPGLAPYDAESFAKLGISPESFAQRARRVADALLASLQPDWVYDEQGKLSYAVFRGERPIYACLLCAPSLPRLFEKAFGEEIWLVAPDRHALYVFPPHEATLQDFSADLAERFLTDPYAASCEIFSWKKGLVDPVVIGSFKP